MKEMVEWSESIMVTKRILVTGGAGFVGSHLCERLLDEGHHIICLDNVLTGNKNNVNHLMTSDRFEWIQHDIQKEFEIKVDEIYNLACPASPPQYQIDPINTMKTNVIGTLNLLELARINRAKFLQASTSEVYGNPLIHPQHENYNGNVNVTGPRACYDEGKRAAETLCFDFYRMYNVDVRVVRIFNTYGPRMNALDGRVVSNFITQALRGENITIYGDGTQTRSFCYVDDLVDGIILMMNNSKNFVGPVNLGNPGEFTINELAEKIVHLTGSHSKLTYSELPKDDPIKRKPNISLAMKELGWYPKINLENGLEKMIAYYHSIIDEKGR